MNSALALYQKIDDPIKAAKEAGIWLAQSGLLGANVAAAVGSVVALDAFARGIPITEVPLRYHYFAGKLTMKAETMLADFQAIGGRCKIVSNTAEDVTITLAIDDETETFSTTWEMAQAEKWPYGKEDKKGNRAIKDNWASPVARADMLWARTVSRGIRKLRPGICAGKYTPEEVQDLAEYAEAINGNGREVKTYDAEEAIAAAASSKVISAVVRPAAPVAAAMPTTAIADKQQGDNAADGFATSEQTERIRQLFTDLAVPVESQEKALQKRNVTALRSLTSEQAAELIAALESRLQQAEASKLPEDITAMPDSAPCTQTQIDAIKRVIGEIEENDTEFPAKYKARLTAQGKQRTADLSIKQADAVLASLCITNLSLFFERSLEQLVTDHAADTEPPKN